MGWGGETIRSGGDYCFLTPERYLKLMGDMAKKLDSSFEIPAKRIHNSSLNDLREEFNIDMNSWEVTSHIYPETRCRHHCGKLAVEKYFSNKYLLMPALDPQLQRLKLNSSDCTDKMLLVALIFVRYLPELLDVQFEGGREIKKSTLDFAKKINDISPFAPKNYEYISGPNINRYGVQKYYGSENKLTQWEETGDIVKKEDINNYLISLFRTKKFRKDFEKYFSSEIYENISSSFDKITYFSLQKSYAPFSILKVINDIQFSKFYNNSNITDWFDSYDESKSIKDDLIARVIKSNLFDEGYYKSQFNGIAPTDCISHYLDFGFKEGKNPSELFDGNYYLNSNKDVKDSGMNPLIHYILYGCLEHRKIKSVDK